MDYYGLMLHFSRPRHLRPLRSLALLWPLLAASLGSHATPSTQPPAADAAAAHTAVPMAAPPEVLTAELFYEILLGEISLQEGQTQTSYELMLDAARRSQQPQLYRRAIEIALQARSGEAALAAAHAWKQDHPSSREANRFVLQILVALNRIEASVEPLRQELAHTPDVQHIAALLSIPQFYARASDKALAATVVEQALQSDLSDPQYSAAAWSVLGRMRLAADDKSGALTAAQQAYTLAPQGEPGLLLALELLDNDVLGAQAFITPYFAGNATPELRLAYARVLINRQRYAEATTQLEQATQQQPNNPESWLLLASLQLQDNLLERAEQALQQFMTQAEQYGDGNVRQNILTQGYLLGAQLAEKRQQYDQALAWLERIERGEEMVRVQVRRASLLARQGQLQEARALLHALPASKPEERRLQLAAEVQLLRDAQEYAQAYDLQAELLRLAPQDIDLLYDQAMLAEKIGRLDTMETLLRQIMARQPDYHHAYNALGYSLADRGERLQEAQQLIEKALSYAPGDPFITDSLGWVLFRQGQAEQARTLLLQAWEKRPDAEIAAHLGEVLWSLHEQERARDVWRAGLRLHPDNAILRATMQRFGVAP